MGDKSYQLGMKNVKFASNESLEIPPQKYEENIEIKSLWYNLDDIESFKNNTQSNKRDHHVLSVVGSKEKIPVIGDDNYFPLSMQIDENKGLTAKSSNRLMNSSERRKRQQYIQQIVLQAQQSMAEYELAILYSKLTSWSKEVALKRANMLCTDINIIEDTNDANLSMHNKRIKR